MNKTTRNGKMEFKFLFYFCLDHNDPPVAVAGKDQVIYLPMRSTIVDGSMSHDDEFIETFHWTRTGVSPAAGVCWV